MQLKVECVTIYFLEFDHEILISFGSKADIDIKTNKIEKIGAWGNF